MMPASCFMPLAQAAAERDQVRAFHTPRRRPRLLAAVVAIAVGATGLLLALNLAAAAEPAWRAML